MSQTRFRELIKAGETLEQIRSMVGGKGRGKGKTAAAAPAPVPVITCETHCKYWQHGLCDFDWPEAGGTFADECSNYENRKNRNELDKNTG